MVRLLQPALAFAAVERSGSPRYRRIVAREQGDADLLEPYPRDVRRWWVAVAAFTFAVIAAVADPGGWVQLGVLALPVAMFTLWVPVPRLPLSVLVVGVLVPVVVVQLTGRLEPAMFLVSLLAVVVARSVESPWRAGLVCAIAAVIPVVVVLLQPAGNRINWGLWVVGVVFPAAVGRVMYRQDQLTRQLDLARQQLARQAQLEQRRGIARDVHDLVGHGLSAMLLQVASARHVLRRDLDAAEEALRSAEQVGRRSMAELRGTVNLLRSPGDSTATDSLPDFARLGELVDSVRGEGLVVDYRPSGDFADVPARVGVALYRIAQEALHNAIRHAPSADTRVTVAVTAIGVDLKVDSVGVQPKLADANRTHFGLIGMRERAAMIGAELEAGATEQGWRVRCRVPVSVP